uniref:DUF6598 domain-containing protein n=1 Tax=Leersia perrieri TaxID=77586 RepID=A0A0D9V2V1_9ORYZ
MGYKSRSMGDTEEKMQSGTVGRLIKDGTVSPRETANDEVTESSPIGRAATDEATESSPIRGAAAVDVTDRYLIGTVAKDEIMESDPTAEVYQPAKNYPLSCHRDAQLELMRFTVATDDCFRDSEVCQTHLPCEMVQIFSLKLAKTPIKSDPIQLYGYIAARDDVDFMLNYVFYRSRDDPIIIQQGSLIEMTGPKRGIQMYYNIMFEFDMRMKSGKDEEDDLPLIDGLTELTETFLRFEQLTLHIKGDFGAVDMSLGAVLNGVEATVEVAISELVSAFDLSLSCDLTMLEERGELQLFSGTISESCGLRRFVMAVRLDTMMHLKFKVDKKDSNVVEHFCSFEAKQHGRNIHQIKSELANIFVKVTWSTILSV